MGNYSKEYCVEMHRKLWNTVYEIIQKYTQEEVDEYIDELDEGFIYNLKGQALEKMKREGDEIPDSMVSSEYNRCFACLYSFSEAHSCQKCPFCWNTTKETENYSCCNAQYGQLENLEFETIDELLRLVKEIAELPVREDV